MTAPMPTECDPERVERLAEVLHVVGTRPGFAELDAWTRWTTLAAAAIAADPSPAEEAVKRVEALLAAVRGYDAGPDDLLDRLHVSVRQVRAALASPAPAPQGEPDIGDTCCGRCPGSSCYVDQVTGA